MCECVGERRGGRGWAGAREDDDAWGEETVTRAVWTELAKLQAEVETVCALVGRGGSETASGGLVTEKGWACARKQDAHSILRLLPLRPPATSDGEEIPVRVDHAATTLPTGSHHLVNMNPNPDPKLPMHNGQSWPQCSKSREQVSYVAPRLYGLLGNVLWQAGVALALAWDLDTMRFHGRYDCTLPCSQVELHV